MTAIWRKGWNVFWCSMCSICPKIRKYKHLYSEFYIVFVLTEDNKRNSRFTDDLLLVCENYLFLKVSLRTWTSYYKYFLSDSKIRTFLVNMFLKRLVAHREDVKISLFLQNGSVKISLTFAPFSCLTQGSARASSVVQRWATGWTIEGSSPGRGWEFFSSPPRPDRFWGSTSLLFSGSQDLFLCRKSGRDVKLTTHLSSAQVKECV
jgi:hypothetical protein